MSSPLLRLLVAGAGSMALCAPAAAHGFGQRYELPLPLSLYLYGTAAVVVVTFLVVGLFVRRAGPAARDAPSDLLAHPAARLLARSGLVPLVQTAAVALFVVTVAAGLVGSANPYRNIAPTMVWIIVWVGVAYLSAFVGDVWALINPWRTLFVWAEAAYRLFGGSRAFCLHLPYPRWLGAWPAVALLLAFAWLELIYRTPAVPATIACLATGYSIITFAGMAAFGADTWLRHGEVFSVAFGTFARFAPIQARTGPRGSQLVLRPYGAGLLEGGPASLSMTAFVLLLLSTVLYDGFLNTPEWSAIERAIGGLFTNPGERELIALQTAGLGAFWLLFLAVYFAVCAMMRAAARGRSTREIAGHFVFTLVPIAIGYHLAHYLVFLLIQGQYIIPLISDPFGWGWNLFGSAGYRVDIAIVGARFAWYAAVAAIVVGHVIAVYLAHTQALRLFEERRTALHSQVPLTALMVLYTFVSLSILAEPLVARREPAQASAVAATVAVPADAVLPEAGTGRLQPVGADKTARAKLTYRVLGSAFHDGTRTSVPDLLYATMFAYRWGAWSGQGDGRYDPVADRATALLRRQLVALRPIGSDAVSRSFRIGDVSFVREIFTIEIYANVAPLDPEQDGMLAPPWSTIPWHLIALMEEAVIRGWAAFSRDEAVRLNVEWLDLVRSDPLRARLAPLVDAFERDGYRPASLQPLVSAEDARRRWAALAAFLKERGHLLVTNGPYLLKRRSAESVTLEAFRDLTYPLGVGSYDAYATPRRGYITAVEQANRRLTLSGDIETVVRYGRDERIERGPIRSTPRDVLRRAAPECRYMITDHQGRPVATGTAPLGDDLTFRIDLDGDLAAGDYDVAALIAVNGNVMNADIRRFRIRIPSER
jgi:hypothetical protein